MSNGITKEAVLRVFPEVLQRSEAISTLGDVFADYLSGAVAEAKLCAIYPNIDTLEEKALDILAYDFKIDWWDETLSLEQKRRVFKKSFYVHKHLGTVQSVKTAVSAVHPDSEVLEWMDYNGDPYFFKLRVNITDGQPTAALHNALLDNVNFYKSARSVLEAVEYFILFEDRAELNLYAGIGMQARISSEVDCDTPAMADVDFFIDTDGVILTNEDLAWLCELA